MTKQEKLAALLTEIRGIADKTKNEKRDRTAEENQTLDAKLAEVRNLEAEIARDEQIEATEKRLNESRGRSTNSSDPAAGNSLGMPEKDFRQFSILRAIQLRMDGRELDGIEGEVHAEMDKRYGKSARGGKLGTIRVPLDLAISKRALNTTTGTGGVNSSVMYTQFIDLLRNKAVVQQAGARMITDLVGNVAIPRQSGGSTAYWVTEGNAPTASNQTMDSVSLAPKTVAAYTDVTRKFALQTSIDAEAFVRDDLAKVLSLAIDLAAINGSGVAAEPLGLLQNSGISTVDFAGANPTWAKVVALETAVAASNADMGKLAYITNAQVKGLLKTTPKFTSTGFPIWENGDIVNGYKAFSTNQVSASLSSAAEPTAGAFSAMLFGNFDDLIIAMWGGLDVLVDPYTGSSSGTVRVTAFQDCDIKVRHNASFAKGYDILDT